VGVLELDDDVLKVAEWACMIEEYYSRQHLAESRRRLEDHDQQLGNGTEVAIELRAR
jgi:hypothetical protein